MRKIDTFDFIKIKTFLSVKSTIKRMKRQPQNGRKYLQNMYLNKDISKKCKYPQSSTKGT